MLYNNKTKGKYRPDYKNPRHFAGETLSQPKSINYSTKTINVSRYAFVHGFNCCFLQLDLGIYVYQSDHINVIMRQGKKLILKNVQLCLKNLKTHSIKTKKSLVKRKATTYMIFELTINGFLSAFTEATSGDKFYSNDKYYSNIIQMINSN